MLKVKGKWRYKYHALSWGSAPKATARQTSGNHNGIHSRLDRGEFGGEQRG